MEGLANHSTHSNAGAHCCRFGVSSLVRLHLLRTLNAATKRSDHTTLSVVALPGASATDLFVHIVSRMAASSPSPVAGFEHGGIFRLKDRGRNGKSASLPKNPLHPHSSQPFPSHVGSRRLGSKRQMEKSSTSSIPSVVLEKRVTLVRHGQSNWNELGKLQGSSDFSILTSKGEAQAEITRKTLQVCVCTA